MLKTFKHSRICRFIKGTWPLMRWNKSKGRFFSHWDVDHDHPPVHPYTKYLNTTIPKRFKNKIHVNSEHLIYSKLPKMVKMSKSSHICLNLTRLVCRIFSSRRVVELLKKAAQLLAANCFLIDDCCCHLNIIFCGCSYRLPKSIYRNACLPAAAFGWAAKYY